MLINPARAFLTFFLVVPILFSGPANAQKFRQQLPITIRENSVYVTVHINGRGPYTFLLDSGTPSIGRIDYRVAKALRLNIVGYQENTDGLHIKREILVAVDKLSIGQVAHSSLKLIASDYNATAKSVQIDGVIGRDFFYDYLLTIDGPTRQLIVSRDALDAHATGVVSYQKPFIIAGKVGQRNLFFNLDTGSNVSLHFPSYLLAGVHYVNTANKRVITSANTTFEMQEAIVTDELVLGSIQLKNQKIYYSEKANQINVGEDFLKEHRLTIDQRRKLVRID